MTRPKVFLTRKLPNTAMTRLHKICELDVWEDELPPPYPDLKARAAQADGLFCLLTDRIDAELIAAAPQLKVISQMAVGYDNVDVAAATAAGIPVGNTPGVLTEATADLAFALLMAAARRLGEGERFVHAGKWQTWSPTLLLGQEVYGATLGIVGFGRIGQAVARRAAGFGMRILYSSRRPVEIDGIKAEHVSLEDLLAQSDFISLHTPLTPETTHLINAETLSMMKSSAILINTARGPVVDPDALYQALKIGQIAYAALDVTEPEPILMDSPLLELHNCLIVPHIGSSTVATRDRMAHMAIDNLEA